MSASSPQQDGPGAGRLLRRPEVEHETGLSCATIYRQIEAGTFPRPRRIGRRAVAWCASAIEAWKQSRPFNDG